MLYYTPMITYEDFAKLDIKIGKVVSAQKVPDADRLIKLVVDVGEETPRQIMSAISEFYPDPSVLEKKLVPVLVNLEPKTFRGYQSQGMLVAADDGNTPILLHPEKDIPAGSPVQ